ncbi:MAG: hypothetical protein MAG551_01232 [Candidatus Scalindua arabica]|uniref:Uncharacterized protein n=1 Tax=Candidatus Scalindua arabica TaxID=1127984 RepID=A0A942A3Y9_9BACT|nr:hypothetical protein [Candidatus Scalindua arabica]
MFTGTVTHVKENPVQAVFDAATLTGLGFGIAEATDGKSTNNADSSGGAGGGGFGGGGG